MNRRNAGTYIRIQGYVLSREWKNERVFCNVGNSGFVIIFYGTVGSL